MNIKILIFFLGALVLSGCNEESRQQHEIVKLGMIHDQAIERNMRRGAFIENQEKRNIEHAEKMRDKEIKHIEKTQAEKNEHDKFVKAKRYATIEAVFNAFFPIFGLIVGIFFAFAGIIHVSNKASETSKHNAQKELDAKKYAIDVFIANKEKFTEKECVQILAAKIAFDRDTPQSA